jgi:hypothetical protein
MQGAFQWVLMQPSARPHFSAGITQGLMLAGLTEENNGIGAWDTKVNFRNWF